MPANFERFTERARHALAFAQEEAKRLRHDYVGTEHLLLGVLLGGGDTAQPLSGLGLTAERAEQALAAEFAAHQARRQAG